jgi:hypothetical protein
MQRIPGTTAAYAILAVTMACVVSMAAGFGWVLRAWIH